jgi:GT2 family glycosyltransferase
VSGPAVSIVVPFRAPDERLHECLAGMARLRGDFELLLLPDGPLDEALLPPELRARARILPTGPRNPAAKRNAALAAGRGRFFAFIDSDASPETDWLERAVELLEADPGLGACGGPDLLPPSAGVLERGAWDVIHTVWGTRGLYRSGRGPGGVEDSRELPTCNLVVRREPVERGLRFDETRRVGEDVDFCRGLRRLGLRIAWSPDVRVLHHCRPLFRSFLGRVFQLAADRAGYFAAAPRLNSPRYLAPPLFALCVLLGGAAAALRPGLRPVYAAALALYALAVVATGRGGPGRRLLFLAGTFLAHLVYGLGFLAGLLRRLGKSDPARS